MQHQNFDPNSVVFETIVLGASGLDTCEVVKNVVERCNLPHLGDFLHDLADRLFDPEEAFGRRYQREAVRHNWLQVISPVSGRIATSRSSYVVGAGIIFFEFADWPDYFVASSRISVGYPLTGLFIPQASFMLKWENVEGGIARSKRLAAKLKGIQPVHLETLAATIGAGDRAEATNAKRTRTYIVVGHMNFAHHLWNELSALEKLFSEGVCDPVPELVVTNEPLGAIDSIFPELAGWPITRLKAHELVSANEPGRLFVNLGSFRVSSALRTRLVTYALKHVSAPSLSVLNDVRNVNAPVFWLSVRTNKPTFLNQREVLVSIAAALLKQHRNCAILFDGFSLPCDWKQAQGDDLERMTTLSRAGKDEIDAIIGELTRKSGPLPSQRIVNVGGLGILDTIALAQLADAYFCHAGTVQHKIGWTANRPGLVHGNRGSRSARQHAERMQDGIEPGVLDPVMLDYPGKGEVNYRALDCESLAQFVTRYFDTCLSSRS